MAVSDELVWLIGQLRGTASRRERLRVVARGWRTLRNLSPSDRLMVAKELGFEGAERLVEQLSRRGGASPALVLELLEKAEAATPEQIAAMMHGVTQPEGRRSLGERFFDAAKTWVADLESWDPDTEDVPEVLAEAQPDLFPELGPNRETATEPSDEKIIQVPPVPPPTTADEGAVKGAPPGAEPVEATGDVGRGEDLEAELESEPVPSFDGEEVAAAKPTEVEAPPSLPEPVPPSPEPSDEPSLVVARRREVEVEPTVELDADIGHLMDDLDEHPSIISNLRALSESVAGLAGVGPTELKALLDRFPDGWARRRALETLFRARIPARFSVALQLVDRLNDPAQRRWALSTLASTRHLEPHHLEELLERPLPATFRRRLQRPPIES